ncbi:ORF6N domain-containing protein [Candidatus Margulisiibacteriota bacterium]
MKNNIMPVEVIESKIYLIRGKKVMLDRDLAFLYGVSTTRLNEQVKRNIKRFPEDFMFQLNNDEFNNLISQIAISRWGGTRKLPYAFTEHGIAMLSSVLHSDRAILVNIEIMRTFSRLRKMISENKELALQLKELELRVDSIDNDVVEIFKKIKKLVSIPKETHKIKKIGFARDK